MRGIPASRVLSVAADARRTAIPNQILPEVAEHRLGEGGDGEWGVEDEGPITQIDVLHLAGDAGPVEKHRHRHCGDANVHGRGNGALRLL